VNQTTCLTLVIKAAILWNTVYLAAVERARSENFDVDAGLAPKSLRPLREPEQVA
jgi:hypothetical protein